MMEERVVRDKTPKRRKALEDLRRGGQPNRKKENIHKTLSKKHILFNHDGIVAADIVHTTAKKS
jgi:hypothetical protein